MDRKVIAIERLLTIDDAVRVIADMARCAAASELVFDFAGLQYAKTLPTALFARELRLLMRSRNGQGLKTRCTGYNEDKSLSLSYLGFVGFFDFIGIAGCGKKVRASAEVQGVCPYLAITKYNYQRFKVAAEYDPFRREYDYIADESQKIANLLATHGTQCTLVGYAIREVLRNAYEHSSSADFYAMGQTWSDGSAELVIMDDGCGMLATLKKKYPRLTNEHEAILEALKPGVSCADFENNKYNNSGFGLYVLSEFAKRHGSICIVSGDVLVRVEGEDVRQERVMTDGSFVGIHLNPIPKNAKAEMENIVAAGEKISSVSEYPVRPSKETLNF